MTFSLTPKKTSKYTSFNGSFDAKYGSETEYPRSSDILNSNGISPRLWSIKQHENYHMGMLYEADYEKYGPCIPDNELPGKCYQKSRRINEKISYQLYKKKENDYINIFSSNRIKIDSMNSINDWGIKELVVDAKDNAIAAITPPFESTNRANTHLRKYNKKGRLLWSNSALPGIPRNERSKIAVYDLVADRSGDIIACYGYKTNADTIFLTKFNGKNGSTIWTTKPISEYFQRSDNYYGGSTGISGENSLILAGKNSILLVAHGEFPDLFWGTRVIQVETNTGRTTDSKDIDTNTSSYTSEIFSRRNNVYLRSPSGAYSLGKINFKEPETNTQSIKAPLKYKSKFIDKITNFNPSTDTLEIDTDSFGIDSSATFAAAKNKRKLRKLAKKDFDFLYDQKKGGLYFNENGSDKGFGDGGIIAILKGAPDLTSGNLEFI